MASGKSGRERNAHEARERTRLYKARLELHEGQQRRRTRDNMTAGLVGGLIIAAAIASQFAYYSVGPGAPEPSPTSTPGPTVSPAPTETVPTDPPVTPVPTDNQIDDQPDED